MAYKLVVADSSPSIQKVIRMAFPDSEFDIYSFDNGREVMKSLSQVNPDAVILRLSLPHKDGYEIASYLKKHDQFKQTSLILLKGAFESVNKERIAGLEHDVIVQVPFDSEKLVQMVRGLIEGKADPQTIPEESILDNISVTQNNLDLKEKTTQIEHFSQDDARAKDKSSFHFSPEMREEFEKKVRDLVKKESLDVERELEKRVRTLLLTELKEWLNKELEEIREQIKRQMEYK